jgi:hypothetical protein
MTVSGNSGSRKLNPDIGQRPGVLMHARRLQTPKPHRDCKALRYHSEANQYRNMQATTGMSLMIQLHIKGAP